MLWFDPVFFIRRWIAESLTRADWAPIATYYLGRVYAFSLPWHHVFVMTAAVVPLGILALAAGGAVAGLRRVDPLAVLAAGTVAFFWLTMLMPRTPHHDGARLFIVVFPFLGMLAGYGVGRAWQLAGGWLRAALFVVGLGPAAVQLAWIHPYELAYYS